VINRSVLEIKAYGAWNGGTLTDNTIYENKGMFFKGDITVNLKTIEERIGIRSRMVAPDDVRIGSIALQNLLDTAKIDPNQIKMIVGATNVGDDKYDPGPLIRYPFEIIKAVCPEAIPLDLYAGCPGYNVSVELLLMLTLSGYLKQGDISIVVGLKIFTGPRPLPRSTPPTSFLVMMPWPPPSKPPPVAFQTTAGFKSKKPTVPYHMILSLNSLNQFWN